MDGGVCEREEEWRWWISVNLLPVFVGLYNHRKPRCAGEGSAKGERRRSLDDDRGRWLRATRRRGRRETVAGGGDDGEADEDDGEDGESG